MNTDRTTIHMVVGFVALIGLLSLLGNYVLSYLSKTVPPHLDMLPYAALTGLLGLLAKTSTHPGDGDPPAPVEIQQPPGKPVPVIEKPAVFSPASGEEIGDGEQVAAAAEEEPGYPDGVIPETKTVFPARGEGVLPLVPDAKPGEVQ